MPPARVVLFHSTTAHSHSLRFAPSAALQYSLPVAMPFHSSPRTLTVFPLLTDRYIDPATTKPSSLPAGRFRLFFPRTITRSFLRLLLPCHLQFDPRLVELARQICL